MFKILACVFLVAVAVSDCSIVSDSTNQGLNVGSTDSNVAQNNIQNVNAGSYGIGGGYYPGIHRSPLSYYPRYPVGYYPPSAYYPGYIPRWGGVGNIVSASSNTGANIASSNSNVNQNDIQNVNQNQGYNYWPLY